MRARLAVEKSLTMAAPELFQVEEESHLKKFLLDNGLDQYFNSIVDNGYDDFEFISKFDAIEVVEMLEDCGIKKKGHIKKFEALLKANKYKPKELPTSDEASSNDKECFKDSELEENLATKKCM